MRFCFNVSIRSAAPAVALAVAVHASTSRGLTPPTLDSTMRLTHCSCRIPSPPSPTETPCNDMPSRGFDLNSFR